MLYKIWHFEFKASQNTSNIQTNEDMQEEKRIKGSRFEFYLFMYKKWKNDFLQGCTDGTSGRHVVMVVWEKARNDDQKQLRKR